MFQPGYSTAARGVVTIAATSATGSTMQPMHTHVSMIRRLTDGAYSLAGVTELRELRTIYATTVSGVL